MLVTRRNDELVLVEQNDHGALAGEFVEHWGNAGFAGATSRDEVAMGTAMHDEGWREADFAPLFNEHDKRPMQFLEVPLEEHLPLYKRGVDRVYEKDPYAGLLVSMHWTGLYRDRWGMQTGKTGIKPTDATAEHALRDQHVAAEEHRWARTKAELIGSSFRSTFEQRLWFHYDLLQVWDLLSLYVSVAHHGVSVSGPTPPVTFASTLARLDQDPGPRVIENVPTSVDGPRAQLTLTPVAPGVVMLDPWPFSTKAVEASVKSTAIPDASYDSGQHVSEVMATATPSHLDVLFVPPQDG